ncbi:MAG: hypothetical protein LBT17_00970 [Mycoplasmataceae bacterium]|jgi:hypothetical protein|nr:hypothetical protein [Mycoplasmataceae bacterium]
MAGLSWKKNGYKLRVRVEVPGEMCYYFYSIESVLGYLQKLQKRKKIEQHLKIEVSGTKENK